MDAIRKLALLAHGPPRRGDVTSKLVLWDASTEVEPEPGVGPDPVPRVLRVTITPSSTMAHH